MSNPVRVLHAAVNMNRGGAETLVMNLYRNIDRSKVQFDFLTCKEGVFDAEILELGGKVHRIPYVTEIGHFGYLKALHSFFAAHREYKILHSHMDKMSGFVLRAAKKAGVPVRVAHSHSTNSEGGVSARIYKWYASQFISSCATNFMACSYSAANWLFGKNSGGCLIIKNGINLKNFTCSPDVRKQIRDDLGINENCLVVGHVGRFYEPKNHDFIIDIFEEFARFNPDSVLILVGDGLLRSVIQNKVTGLNLQDKVKFLGVRSDVNRLLQAFDVFIFPSLYEGLPVTLIEAQGAGVPCLISNTITSEVDMGINLVEYLPLNDKMAWVERIKNMGIRSFTDIKAEALVKKGYDIQNISAWIKDFYLNAKR